MANRYWVGGSANWDATAGSKWSTTSGGAGGAAVPTAADDVIFDNATGHGTVTIPASTSVVCRSLNCVDGAGGAFVDSLQFAATTSVLTIGDGTAGASNVAIKLGSGMGVTLTGIGTINFVSTSATQQTITTGGKTLPNITINGAGSSYILGDALTWSGTFTLTAGTFDSGNYSMTGSVLSTSGSTARTLTLGSSTITLSSSSTPIAVIGTNLTMTSNTSSITVSGVNPRVNVAVNMNGSSLTYTGGGAGTIASGGTWNNVTVTGTASLTDGLGLEGTLTVTGTFTATGNSAVNRVIIQSNTLGTTRTITAASVSLTNVDFMDITGAGAASWSGTTVGDRQGNSGITFTTPATQTRDSTNGSAWGVAARWTSRVPLPQDDVVLNASSGSISSTNVLCLGKSIDMTNYAGTITLNTNANIFSIYGSLNLGGVTWGAAVNTFNIDFMGRGSHTITSNGKTFFPAASNQTVRINAFGGTYTLADAFTQNVPASTGISFNLITGSFATSNYNMSIGRFVTSGSLTRSATWGTSVISLLHENSNVLISVATSGLTWSAASSTWTVALASIKAINRSIDLQGQIIGTLNYTVANSNAGITITSTCTINTINIGSGRLLTITAGQQLNTINTPTLTGTANGYVYMPGDNYGASAPDSAALSITGDMDFRQRMSFDTLAPSGSMRLAAKYNSTGSQQTWRLYMTAASALVLDQSTTGANSSLATSSATLSATGLSAGTTYWIRFTREQSTGYVKFYYAADNASMPSSWTQIGTTQTATTSALFDSTASLTIGGDSTTTNPNPGRYYWSQLRNNILDNGTGIQFDAVFSSKTVGADTFTESSSNAATVTMNGLSVYGDGRLQIVSSTGGTKAYLSKPQGGAITGVDYLKIQDIRMYQALNFFVGANSTLVSGNSGIYTSATTYTHKQSANTYTGSSSTSITATFPTATTSGNLLVAYVNSGGTTGGGSTMTGWTQAVASTNSGSGFIYYKIADGTETTVTYSQTTSRVLTIGIVEYTGFTGTPTLDVTDSNSTGSPTTSLSTTATTGPTNTVQPALALAFAGGTSNLAQWVSATNSYIPDFTTGGISGGGNYMHSVVKELTALAANDTTITWTTSRANVYTGLAVFKNVSTANHNALLLMGVG